MSHSFPDLSPQPDNGVRQQRVALCQALLEDECTPCPERLLITSKNVWCPPHGREYAKLTRAYKELSTEYSGLEVNSTLSASQISALADVEEIAKLVAGLEKWRDTAAREATARRAHHTRFFIETGT